MRHDERLRLSMKHEAPRACAPIRVLSAFTGAGGLDLGLEAAGYKVLGCIERDPLAQQTLQANRSWRQLDPGDISEVARGLTPKEFGLEVGDLEVLAGGPPCQPFSKAAQWASGARAGMVDPRSQSLHGFLALIEKFLPKVILIENVVGFVRGHASALSVITWKLEEFNQLYGTSYKLAFKPMNAVEFGVPQRRERAILVALRDGSEFDWPEPTHGQRPVCAWDAIGELDEEEKPIAVGKWADLLPSIPEGSNYLWHTDRGGGKPLFGYRTRYWSFLLKLAKAEPAWTLSAQPGPATGPFHWDNRPLSIREMLRLQTFPESWSVVGDYRDQVRQVGNATPPLLAEVIGRAIGRQVFGKIYRGVTRLAIQRAGSVPEPARCGPMPSTYERLVGPHAPHPGTGRGPRPTSVAPVAA